MDDDTRKSDKDVNKIETEYGHYEEPFTKRNIKSLEQSEIL